VKAGIRPTPVFDSLNLMPISSEVLSFGLVAIPVRVHTAVQDETIRFHPCTKSVVAGCGTGLYARFAMRR